MNSFVLYAKKILHWNFDIIKSDANETTELVWELLGKDSWGLFVKRRNCAYYAVPAVGEYDVFIGVVSTPSPLSINITLKPLSVLTPVTKYWFSIR